MIVRTSIALLLLTAPTTFAAPLDDYDKLLKKHVDDAGYVDYDALRKDADKLDAYIDHLAKIDLNTLNRDEKLATLINAYNAFTLRLILDHYPLQSIMDIPEEKRWKAKRWNVGGKTVSLDALENEWIRPTFNEPRIHFAVNCASIGCPPLRNEAFRGDKLDQQLEDQTKYALNQDRWLQFDRDAAALRLTKIFEWYKADFEQDGQTVMEFARKYSKELQKPRITMEVPQINYLEWDWKLNRKK